MKSNITLQQLAEYMRNLAYDDFSRKIRWSLGVIHPKTNDGDVGFSGGIWNDPQEATTYMSISFCFSETRGIYNFKSWVNKSEIRWVLEKLLRSMSLNRHRKKSLSNKNFVPNQCRHTIGQALKCMLREINGQRRILMPLIIKGRAVLCTQSVKSVGRNLRIRKV